MSRRPFVSILAIGLMLSGASTIHAATIEKGTVELAPALSFSHSSYSASGGGGSASITTLTGAVGFGVCVSDRGEIVGSLLVNHISGDFGDATNVGLSAGGQLNFSSTSNIVPFLRGQLGILTNSGGGDTSFLVPTIDAGIRILVGNSASVNVSVGYEHQTNALGINDVSANIVALQLGVSIFPNAAR